MVELCVLNSFRRILGNLSKVCLSYGNEFDFKDKGGVARDGACILWAITQVRGYVHLPMVADVHVHQGYLETADEFVHAEGLGA